MPLGGSKGRRYWSQGVSWGPPPCSHPTRVIYKISPPDLQLIHRRTHLVDGSRRRQAVAVAPDARFLPVDLCRMCNGTRAISAEPKSPKFSYAHVTAPTKTQHLQYITEHTSYNVKLGRAPCLNVRHPRHSADRPRSTRRDMRCREFNPRSNMLDMQVITSASTVLQPSSTVYAASHRG